ncbi:MAG: N-acetylmuramoyl-L-alanine amidase, partial [Candidatus Zixiibacteriota bacterium]
YDSLKIIDKNNFVGNLSLAGGDMLTVEILGTPRWDATVSKPGSIDSVPMAEMPPRIQPYWGESVFGAGAVPESLKIRGYYSGFLNIDGRSLPDSSRIYYHLKSPNLDRMIERLVNHPFGEFDFLSLELLKNPDRECKDSSLVFVKINPKEFPRTVLFTDSVQIVRVGPRKGYLTIFQPKGVQALATGREGEWIKLKLSQNQFGWVDQKSIRFLDPGWPPPKSYLKAIRSRSDSNHLTIELPLTAKHVFRAEEEEGNILNLYIYGVISDTDWIRYDFGDNLLRLAQWSQIEPDLYCLKLYFNRPAWGYDVFYAGSTLKLQINRCPQHIERLRDKIIIVDPGHSPDVGAVGPTGLTESVANLNIALALKKELESKGARVIMTRSDMSAVSLYDRPQIAMAADADLYISIHNNALPDGVNPFANNGVSTYYYHPHSIDLARSIQKELLEETGLNDYGLYYGNLAVNRPTQYPAVLVECAFIILPEYEALLKTEKFQSMTARAIRKGIENFLKEYDHE